MLRLYMAEEALYERLIDWLEHGAVPPSTDLTTLRPKGTASFGDTNIAQRGLRLTMVAVPVASYGDGAAVLSDGCTQIVPFGPEKLSQFHGFRDACIDAYRRSVWGWRRTVLYSARK